MSHGCTYVARCDSCAARMWLPNAVAHMLHTWMLLRSFRNPVQKRARARASVRTRAFVRTSVAPGSRPAHCPWCCRGCTTAAGAVRLGTLPPIGSSPS
eukprot:12352605-Alexandrium_andersonii.AAC.1